MGPFIILMLEGDNEQLTKNHETSFLRCLLFEPSVSLKLSVKFSSVNSLSSRRVAELEKTAACISWSGWQSGGKGLSAQPDGMEYEGTRTRGPGVRVGTSESPQNTG